VLVVGAGLGGLAAAVRLAARGYRVRVLERHATPGGRCGLWESEGFKFDTGPTLLLMTDYLRKVFTDAGRKLEDYLDLRQLDPNYRVYYADGTSLDVSSRINRMLEGVERIEPGVGPRFLRFLAETDKL
jgi:phytoene dehydrogenase-like protein